MPDVIVPLHHLPPTEVLLERLRGRGITIRRALPPERAIVLRWLDEYFAKHHWNGETEIALSRTPPTCFLAIHEDSIVGFLCFEVTFRGFIGPGGVVDTHRRLGIFTALILRACRAMHELGYAYGIVGDVADATLGLLLKLGGAPLTTTGPGPYGGMLPLDVIKARNNDSASD
jgi:hypothetical protein